MENELRLLILEDSMEDVMLLKRHLRQGGVQYVECAVETEEDFVNQLGEFNPSIVLADYNLPTFNGLKALEIVRNKNKHLPFILLSGVAGEELAMDALLLGATDYVLKNRLGRLIPSINRAVREIDEQKKNKELEERFNQSQKMEAIGKLAGGVAHDFNNILMAIKMNTEFALKEIETNSQAHEDLNEVLTLANRASSLTRQLLAYSRKQVLELKVVHLNQVVENINKMLSRIIGEDIELNFHLEPNLPYVKVDEGQFEQVIMNLVVNARDAMPNGGLLTLETRKVVLDEEYTKSYLDLNAGEYVLIAVSDNGEGIEPDIFKNIFDPFFTTKEQGKGTGLGLSMVHGIVKQSGGDIHVYSEVGEGTTFRIYLPTVKENIKVASNGTELIDLNGRGRILVVEDEDSVRKAITRTLEKHGYSVLKANCGEEALEIYESNTEPVDLLLTDVVMPGMNGKELSDRIHQLTPDLKTIFLSGYTEDAIVHHGVLEEGITFVQKPVSSKDLLTKIKKLLEE